MNPAKVTFDEAAAWFLGRVLDIVFVHFESFMSGEAWSRLEAPMGPDSKSADDLQLWLITQFLSKVYPGSLSEISETAPSSGMTKVLASSAARPWEPSPWEAAKNLEMLSGYATLTGIPLVVEKVEAPWTDLIEGAETEMRYLRTGMAKGQEPISYSAASLPITLSTGKAMGALYIMMPGMGKRRLDAEVRVLAIFGRIVGETVERQRSAVYSADYNSDIVSKATMKKEQFRVALQELLVRRAGELQKSGGSQFDLRLPFLLLATHAPDPDQIQPASPNKLKEWLVSTMNHIEWKSFVRSHWSQSAHLWEREGFAGEVPGVGMMIALGTLVSKDELDQIRNAFRAR